MKTAHKITTQKKMQHTKSSRHIIGKTHKLRIKHEIKYDL